MASEPHEELARLFYLQSTSRRVRMTRDGRAARAELAERAAANGTGASGGFITAVNGAIFDLFRDCANGLLADCLGLADDIDWNPDEAGWLHAQYDEAIERTGDLEGFRQLLPLQHEPGLDEGIRRLVSEARTTAAVAFGRANLRRQARTPRAEGSKPVERCDCFISHAGEDGKDVAKPLAEELQRRGKTVWFSGSQLTVGDSLRKRIDAGLRSCRYGVVVLSPDFFDKPWPEAELNALQSRAMNEGCKVILPVWHNVTKNQIARYSPLLADLLGVSTSKGMSAVADEIIRALDFEN